MIIGKMIGVKKEMIKSQMILPETKLYERWLFLPFYIDSLEVLVGVY